MASRTLYAQPSFTDMRPTILGPSAGDLEEARIRRLMDTAKLFNLQQEPVFQQKALDLQRSQLDETSRYHQSEIADRATGRQLEARGQDVQQRGQDMTMDAHKEALKSATANNILSHAIARPDIPLSVYADTAQQFGFPELGKALATHHDEMQTEKAKQLGTALKTAATSGDTKTYGELLTTYKNLPDFNELAPKMQKFLPEYAKDIDPTKPGVQTNPLGGHYENVPIQGPTLPPNPNLSHIARAKGLGVASVFVPETQTTLPSRIQRNIPQSLGESIGEVLNAPLAARRFINTAPKLLPPRKFFRDIYAGATR